MDLHAAGNVDVNPVEGQKTATGAQKETFGTGSSAQSEAGKKGGAISGESSNVGSPPACRYQRYHRRYRCRGLF